MKPIKSLLLLALCMMLLTGSALAAKKNPPPQSRPSWMADIEAIAQHPEKIYEVYNGMPLSDFYATWQNLPDWKIVENDTVHSWIVFEREPSDGIVQHFTVYLNKQFHVVSGASLQFDCPDEKITKRLYNYSRNVFSLHYGNIGEQDFCYQQKPMTYPYKWFWTDDKTTTSVLTLLLEKHSLTISSGAWNPYGKY